MGDVIIRKIRLYRFSLPLKRTFRVGKVSVSNRVGILLSMKDDEGHIGYGEALPLPGLHVESVAQCAIELQILAKRLVGQSFTGNLLDWQTVLKAFLKNWDLTPTVRFAAETALMALIAQRNNGFPFQPLADKTASWVHVNALLFGESGSLCVQAQKVYAAGFRYLKIKVGRHPIKEEMAAIKTILQATPPSVFLRLDANRSWTLEQARRLKELPAERIEYIEEPLQNPKDIPAFHRETGLSVALDESMKEAQAEEHLMLQGVSAVVLKATLLGGWQATAHWAKLAGTQGLKVVLSDTFSSGLGIQTLGQMALALGASQTAHGLDTYRLLARDLLSPRLTFTQGRLELLPIPLLQKRINIQRLSEL